MKYEREYDLFIQYYFFYLSAAFTCHVTAKQNINL